MDKSTHQPLRQFHSVVGITRTTDKAQRRFSRVTIPATPLSSVEMQMLEDVWSNFVNESFVTSMSQLKQILLALQVPSQPLSDELIESAFNATKCRFSHRDMVRVLEKCKTIHSKWLHKIRGKELDDDLLEAFVAVGGHEDSTGEVDVGKMKSVVQEFQLQVDLDRIISEMDNDGNADIDFGEFAQLLRESRKKAGRKSSGGDDDDVMVDNSAGVIGASRRSPVQTEQTPDEVCLSSMIQMRSEDDLLVGGGLQRTPAEVSMIDGGGGAAGEYSFMAGAGRRRRNSKDKDHRPGSGSRRDSDGGDGGVGQAPGGGGGPAKARSASVAAMPAGAAGPVGSSTLASSSSANQKAPLATAFYKGGGGLRSMSPQQRRPARRVGAGRASPSRSPSPLVGRSPTKGMTKKHKFAT